MVVPPSVRERQLLCLARALLRSPKLLVCDEATSSVDAITDAQVQKCLRNAVRTFDASLLTIAHRLVTVADYDKVMLLQAGQVKEFDSPGKLLAEKSSAFSQLVDSMGQREAAAIRQIAVSTGPTQLSLKAKASLARSSSHVELVQESLPYFGSDAVDTLIMNEADMVAAAEMHATAATATLEEVTLREEDPKPVEVKDCPAEGDEGEVLDEEATAPEAAGSALSDIPRASAPTATISEDGQAAPEEEPEKAEEPKETARKGEPDKAEEPEGAAGKEEPEEPNPNNVKRAKTADKATSPNAADSKVEKPVRQRKSKAANGREKVEEAVDGPQEVAAEAPTKRRRKSKDGGDGAVEEPTKEVLYRGLPSSVLASLANTLVGWTRSVPSSAHSGWALPSSLPSLLPTSSMLTSPPAEVNAVSVLEQKAYAENQREVDGLMERCASLLQMAQEGLLTLQETGGEGADAATLVGSANSWGVDYQHLRCTMVLLHGNGDSTVPVACAEWLQGQIPKTVLHRIPEAEHGEAMLLGMSAALRARHPRLAASPGDESGQSGRAAAMVVERRQSSAHRAQPDLVQLSAEASQCARRSAWRNALDLLNSLARRALRAEFRPEGENRRGGWLEKQSSPYEEDAI
eukprot:g9850.t1